MKAWILSIGNELLKGYTVNSNASVIASSLTEIGVKVEKILTVADNEDDILWALEQAYRNSSLAISTGGLGPTSDDVTKQTLCKFFNTSLIFDELIWQHIQQLFQRRNQVAPNINKEQAMVPSQAKIFHNELGTAPALLLQKNHFRYIALPGVPFEMQHILNTKVIPFLRQHFTLNPPNVETFLFSGISESALAEKLTALDADLRQHSVMLAYLPQPGLIKLKIFYHQTNEALACVNKFRNFANTFLSDYLIYNEDLPLAQIVKNIMVQKKLTLVVAESCTGGYLSHLITSIPGSSQYFLGSFVVYSNQLKQTALNVPETILNTTGAVSEETVVQLASEAQKLSKSDYSIAISGIAGPDGGTPTKPVGTVWIAIADHHSIEAQRYLLGKDRLANIQHAAQLALANLIRKLNHIV